MDAACKASISTGVQTSKADDYDERLPQTKEGAAHVEHVQRLCGRRAATRSNLGHRVRMH